MPASSARVEAAGERQTSREAVRERLAAQLRQRGMHPAFVPAVEKALARHAAIRDAVRAMGLGSENRAASKSGRTGGPLAEERTLLRYPLHPGASWIVLDYPRVTARVEAAETLTLPAGRFTGWRIRIDWPDDFGPRDLIHVWYGRCGMLQLESHLEGVAMTPDGHPVGMVVSDTGEMLVDLDLANRSCR